VPITSASRVNLASGSTNKVKIVFQYPQVEFNLLKPPASHAGGVGITLHHATWSQSLGSKNDSYIDWIPVADYWFTPDETIQKEGIKLKFSYNGTEITQSNPITFKSAQQYTVNIEFVQVQVGNLIIETTGITDYPPIMSIYVSHGGNTSKFDSVSFSNGLYYFDIPTTILSFSIQAITSIDNYVLKSSSPVDNYTIPANIDITSAKTTKLNLIFKKTNLDTYKRFRIGMVPIYTPICRQDSVFFVTNNSYGFFFPKPSDIQKTSTGIQNPSPFNKYYLAGQTVQCNEIFYLNNRGPIDSGPPGAFWTEVENNIVIPAKYKALALAQAYLTFINLTGINQKLINAGATPEQINKITSTLGPNLYLATVSDETGFWDYEGDYAGGYFQLNIKPSTISANAVLDGTQSFAKNFNFLNDVSKDAVAVGRKFPTSAIIASYLYAVDFMYYTYLGPKELTTNNDISAYAVKRTKANTEYLETISRNRYWDTTLGGFVPTKEGENYVAGYAYPSYYALMRIIAYSYNHGTRNPVILQLISNSKEINKTIPYVANEHGQYIYTVPEYYKLLESAPDEYNVAISPDDVQAYLEYLKPFGIFGSNTDEIIKAGLDAIPQAMSSKSYAYNSIGFYSVFNEIIVAMLKEINPGFIPPE